MDIGERKLKILSIVVNNYIETGEPVGSKKVCTELENSVSSATVRNDMAELGTYGFLDQPHTSAGRIPTRQGIRLYVDKLMQKKELDGRERDYIDSMLAEFSREPERFLQSACEFLAAETNLAVLYTTPSDKLARIRQVEIIPTGMRTVILIMVTSVGVLRSRVCRLDVDLYAETVLLFRRVLNEQLAGKVLMEITPAFIQNVAVSLKELMLVISPLLLAASELAKNAMETRLELKGAENLLAHPDIDYMQARALFSLVSSKEELLGIMDTGKSSAKIFIGKEAGRSEFEFLSFIVSMYKIGNMGAGSIGVIGPVRVDYADVCAKVEYFAAAAGQLIMQALGDEN
ncbi:MAG: heat-inducible transcription repressor HrcA [Clostridia bacterium]|nr:heat-inducible transcription repressor HrcA [Clostridia bacterium]